MTSPEGEVVYVGKSKRIRTRLLSYFRCAWPSDKGARIVREATTIDWEYAPSEFAALLQELRLIKRFRPRLNVAMKNDARHFAFIKVTRGAAPSQITAAHLTDGIAVRTRPLCPFGHVARYKGTGSIDEAASFECAVRQTRQKP